MGGGGAPGHDRPNARADLWAPPPRLSGASGRGVKLCRICANMRGIKGFNRKTPSLNTRQPPPKLLIFLAGRLQKTVNGARTSGLFCAVLVPRFQGWGQKVWKLSITKAVNDEKGVIRHSGAVGNRAAKIECHRIHIAVTACNCACSNVIFQICSA